MFAEQPASSDPLFGGTTSVYPSPVLSHGSGHGPLFDPCFGTQSILQDIKKRSYSEKRKFFGKGQATGHGQNHDWGLV